MTNSATSTRRTAPPPAQPAAFHAWHFFLLLSMLAATAVVMLARDNHPAALLLLSAAIICAGLVGLAVSRAIAGFFRKGAELPPLPEAARSQLQREKALILRSLKELEFDRAMGKISEDDAAVIGSNLRARALILMRDLDRPADAEPQPPAAAVAQGTACPSCETVNDEDARFCKSCGARLGSAS